MRSSHENGAPDTSLEQTLEMQSAMLKRRRARRSAQPLDVFVPAMPYQPSRLVQRAWVTTPRFLAAYNATPVRDPPDNLNAFDELGYFAVACKCGSSQFRIRGYQQAEGLFACPLSLECVSCSATADLFDVKIHGYDAELGHGCYSIRGEGDSCAFDCPSCKAQSFAVLAGVSYQIEPLEDLPAEAQERAQDLFDSFCLVATCAHCGARSNVSDYECA